MSELCFCRALRFYAEHHYHVAQWSEARNQQTFGPAALPHGHDWTLTLWLTGPLDPLTGMIVDLVEVDQILDREVTRRFANRNFREVDAYFVDHQPTTEVLAEYFATRLQTCFHKQRLVRLRIAEMDELFAEWHA